MTYDCETSDSKVTFQGTLWEIMSLLDKVKWFFAVRIFPFISKDKRESYYNALKLYEVLNDKFEELQLNEPKLPSWANKEPWQILMMTMFVTPKKPLEWINCNFAVTKDGAYINK